MLEENIISLQSATWQKQKTWSRPHHEDASKGKSVDSCYCGITSLYRHKDATRASSLIVATVVITSLYRHKDLVRASFWWFSLKKKRTKVRWFIFELFFKRLGRDDRAFFPTSKTFLSLDYLIQRYKVIGYAETTIGEVRCLRRLVISIRMDINIPGTIIYEFRDILVF